jgi:hypothetical protein
LVVLVPHIPWCVPNSYSNLSYDSKSTYSQLALSLLHFKN